MQLPLFHSMRAEYCQQTLLISFSLNVSLLLVRFPGLGVKGTVDDEGILEVDMAMRRFARSASSSRGS